VLHPPPGLAPDGPQEPVTGVEPGFFLTVARLLPYKRVDVVLDAVAGLPGARLVVVGHGPDRDRLARRAARAVTFLNQVSDAQLRWLYANSCTLVTAAHDDFGLTALEARAFAKPVVAIAEGGYLETVEHGVTGLLVTEPTAPAFREALALTLKVAWRGGVPRRTAVTSPGEQFAAAIRALVEAQRASAQEGQPTHRRWERRAVTPGTIR
jgi:glycosyltransferase involved in cell wall biosynthesis